MKMKFLSTFFFFVCFSENLFTQNWDWAKVVGGVRSDEGNCVSTDGVGNVFVTGYFYSPTIAFGSTILTNKDTSGNTQDIFIAKFDASGNVLWAKNVGGSGNDFGQSISTDGNGNVFITGGFESSTIIFGSDTLINLGIQNIFIAKYDASGNLLFAKSVGGSSQDVGYSISTDGIGNVFVTGWFQSPSITFGSTTLTNQGFTNIFITKYDAIGNVLWAKSVAGNADDYGVGVSTDGSGNVYLTGSYGYTLTFGTTILSNTGSAEFFIAKYDASGNVLWAKSASGSSNGNSISTDGIGNVFVTGFFKSSTVTFGNTILTNSDSAPDIFIVKYDALGNVLWAKSSTGTSTDVGCGVSTDGIGNVYLTGYFNSSLISFDSDTITNAGYWNIFLTKYDASGNVIWVKSARGDGGDMGYSVSADGSGNVFITGILNSFVTICGSTTLTNTNMGGTNIFLAKLNGISGINEINLDNSFEIYPNPTNGMFTIQANLPTGQAGSHQLLANSQIEIYNVMGEKVYSNSQLPQSTQLTINLSAQAVGIYFLQLTTQQGIARKKIVISR